MFLCDKYFFNPTKMVGIIQNYYNTTFIMKLLIKVDTQ